MTLAADNWRYRVRELLRQMDAEWQSPAPSALGESYARNVSEEASELYRDSAMDEVLG